MSIVCRICGTFPKYGYLARVNPKGQEGIWECRETCDRNRTKAYLASFNQDLNVLNCIQETTNEEPHGV